MSETPQGGAGARQGPAAPAGGSGAPDPAEPPATPDGVVLDDLDEDMVLGATSPTDDAPPRVPAHVPADVLDEEAAVPSTRRARLRAAAVHLRQSVRRGARRSQGSAVSIVICAVTAGVAYLLAKYVAGQPYPVFAPIVVWICLGFQRDRPPRRVAEIGLGASLGVLLGEMVVTVFGPGVLQVVGVMIVAALIARFLDSAELFTSQAAVQSMVVTTMPAAMLQGGAVGRWAEALIGCVLGILVSAFLRREPGRRPRLLGAIVLTDLATVLESAADALESGDQRAAADALATGRGTQKGIDDWDQAARTARDIVRLNPALRAQRRAAEDEVRAAEMADRAMRNARVVARLTRAVVEEERPSPVVAGHVRRLATGARLLAHAKRADHDPTGAREVLESVSRELSPTRHKLTGWREQMVEALLRSLAVDLLQVAGHTHRQARGHLPRDPMGRAAAAAG